MTEFNAVELDLLGDVLRTPAQRHAYLLARELEVLPASDMQKQLAATAWDFLQAISNYQEGAALLEKESQQASLEGEQPDGQQEQVHADGEEQ